MKDCAYSVVPEVLWAKGASQFFCVKCLHITWGRPFISLSLMQLPSSFRCYTVAQGKQIRAEMGWHLKLLRWSLTRWYQPWLSAMPNWTTRSSKHWPNFLLLAQQSCIYLVWQVAQLHFEQLYMNSKSTSGSWDPHTLQAYARTFRCRSYASPRWYGQ